MRYLGSQYARGLWGIKHTRRPVDYLVSIPYDLIMSLVSSNALHLLQVNVAKNLPKDKVLPICNLSVSLGGVNIESVQTFNSRETRMLDWTIDTISYGVQDLVYTRVFAMIIVKENYNIKEENPFEVHAFVCDSR